jgi:hypothetical protein
LKHAIDPIKTENGITFSILLGIFKLAIPKMSMKVAFARCSTPTLFAERLNNSIISIKRINKIKVISAIKKYFNMSFVKYLKSMNGN